MDSAWETVVGGIDFGEGPRWHEGLDAEGAIWFADATGSQIDVPHAGRP